LNPAGAGRHPAPSFFESECPRAGQERNDPMVGNQAPRPGQETKRTSSRPGHVALLQGLERVREGIRQRLDQIEDLARQRSEPPSGAISGRERELERRIADLEESQARSRDEARRLEEQGREAIERLEQDRRQLAEAWEVLEQEQIALARAAHGTPPTVPDAAGYAPAKSLRANLNSEGENPLAREILKQFQSLRRDVRRNAHELHPD
jgi:DNA repair exonuclease SbcCD ATPase subunit